MKQLLKDKLKKAEDKGQEAAEAQPSAPPVLKKVS